MTTGIMSSIKGLEYCDSQVFPSFEWFTIPTILDNDWFISSHHLPVSGNFLVPANPKIPYSDTSKCFMTLLPHFLVLKIMSSWQKTMISFLESIRALLYIFVKEVPSGLSYDNIWRISSRFDYVSSDISGKLNEILFFYYFSGNIARNVVKTSWNPSEIIIW